MTDDRNNAAMKELEARVSELELMQELLLRILSTTRPLSNVLEQFGATETQQQALYKFLDELVGRVRGPEANRPSKGYFDLHVSEIFPDFRHDADFRQLLMDTLKVERPAYRTLHQYMTAQGWLIHTEAVDPSPLRRSDR
jgi:hypothetical protein